MKRPGQRRGRVDTRLLQTTDVLPTLADALGADLPWRVDGRPPPAARHARLRINDRELPAHPFSVSTFRRGLDSALRRRHALLGSGDPRGIFALGRPGVLGRPAAEFPALDARIDQAGQLAALRGDARTIPALLSGTVAGGGAGAGRYVGIAVAGRVAAVSKTFVEGGEERFLAPIPEDALHEGANDVRLVGLAAPVARTWGIGPDGASLVAPGGRAVPLGGGGIAARVDGATLADGSLRFQGWAADTAAGRPLTRLVAFVDGVPARIDVRVQRRPDVARSLRAAALARAGFVARVPAGLLDPAGRGHVRLFALDRAARRAVEVVYPAGYAWGG